MISRFIKRLDHDMRCNPTRWSWLFAVFVVAFFGEILWSKLTGQLTSPERQFFWFWFTASVTLLIPFELSIVSSALGTAALMLGTWLRPESGLIPDLATWVLFFITTALIVVFIKQRRDT